MANPEVLDHRDILQRRSLQQTKGSSSIDISYIAESTLLDERRFIERDMQNTNVRLLG